MPQTPKIKTKMLPAGWVFLILGVGFLLFTGILSGSGALISLAILASFIFCISYLLGKRNLTALSLSVEMPERVHAHKAFEFTAYLDNKKSWLSSFFIEVNISIKKSTQLNLNCTWLASAAKFKKRISLPLRGVATQIEAQLNSTFPFAFFKHQMDINLPKSTIVYPRLIIPLELLSCGSLNDVDPQQGAQHGESLGEPRGLRAWQPGDSVKRIHWPASARSLMRGQSLRVREYDPPGFTPVTCALIFHSHAKQGEVYRHDRYERACSLAAGALHFLHGRQVEVTFIADFLGWLPQSCENRSQLIECLSLIAHAERNINSETHELQQIIDAKSQEVDQIIIVSDIAPEAWSESLKYPDNTLLIDIRQIRFSRRSFAQHAKAS